MTIWKDVAHCDACTDFEPCATHEAEIVKSYMETEKPEINTPEALIQAVIEWSKTSPDPDTKNASFLTYPDLQVAIETLSVNEFPQGVTETDERWQRPQKYLFVEHGERNALYKANRVGIRTEGMTLVTTWSPCADCARAIVQCGIVRVIRQSPKDTPVHWKSSIEAGELILTEAGVEVVTVA